MLSGDIAFSGNSDEYDIASRFMRELEGRIIERIPTCNLEWIAVPGNHDCDFLLEDSVRDLVLKEMSADNLDTGLMEKCLAPQAAYWSFIEDLGLGYFSEVPEDRVFCKQMIGVSEATLEFRLINSAITSRLDEVQGGLLFPHALIDQSVASEDTTTIVVSVMHHPFNWFESFNARSLRISIESTSDIILTGHEHETDQYFKIKTTGEQTEYIEGAVLQDTEDSHKNGFNILAIDLSENSQMLHKFNWSRDNGRYEELDGAMPFPFVRNSYRLRNQFRITEEFDNILMDPGANYTHHAKDRLILDDIFVFPDIRQIDLTGREELGTRIVREQLPSFLADEGRVLLFGFDKCGKTTLAKALFQSFRKHALVPVFLRGNDIRRPIESHVSNVILRAYRDQYSTPDETEFEQLERSRKVVIVDDFHRVPGNSRSRDRIVTFLEAKFATVILISGDYVRYDDLLDRTPDDLALWKYTTCEILPFGHLRRSDLIRKWYFLGREFTHDEIELRRESLIAERLVTELIGKNLIPSYPLFVLILLQQIESQTPLETSMASGSYGFLYESLLTLALFKESGLELDLDTQYSYLSELAFHFFVNQSSSVSKGEAIAWHESFCARFSRHLDFNQLIPNFTSAGILSDRDQRLSFKYPYLYYYFVGRYFRDHLHEEEIREYISLMSQRLHHTDSVNILMFLSYLSKDPLILDSVLRASKSLFESSFEADLLNDTDFLAAFIDKIPQLTLDGSDSEERHRGMLEGRNNRAEEEESEEDYESTDIQSVDPDSKLEKVLQINVAFKATQILGQILRNYPGSLLREQKLEIAAEAYSLGLRVLNFMYSSIESNHENIINFLVNLLKESYPEWGDEEVKNQLSVLVFTLVEGLTVLTMRQVSDAVGLEDLSVTFDELVERSSNTSYRYIDVSVRLYHFRTFPEDQVFDLYGKVRKHPFGSQVLRHLVWRYFYLFPAKSSLVQSVCDRLGILVQRPQLYDPRSKLLPA